MGWYGAALAVVGSIVLPVGSARAVVAGITISGGGATAHTGLFRDIDADGTWDSNEPGVGGVRVAATCGAAGGSTVAEAMTAADGSFALTTGGAPCEVRLSISPSLGYFRPGDGAGPLVQLVSASGPMTVGVLSPLDFGDNVTSTDSALAPAAAATALPRIGALVDPPTYSLGNRVWFDMGAGFTNNATRDNGEAAVVGAKLELLDDTLQPVDPDGGGALPPLTTTTDAAGYYRFDGLAAGKYVVRVSASNFATGKVLDGYISSSNFTAGFTKTLNNRDHGIDSLATVTNGVRSAVVTLGATNPTTEADAGATGAGGNGPTGDTNDNLTADFGFVLAIDLSLRKTLARPGPFVPGGPIDFALVATNHGPGSAKSGVQIADELPPGLSFAAVPGTGTDWTCQPTSPFRLLCTYSGPPLDAGQSASTLIVHTVVDPTSDAVTFTNQAVVFPSANEELPESIPEPNPSIPFENCTSVTSVIFPSNNDDCIEVAVVVTYSLGNRLWYDTGAGAATNNGQFDDGELPVVGATVQILGSNGLPFDADGAGPVGTTAVTDAQGFYRFDLLPAGRYTVRVLASNFAPGSVLSTPGTAAAAGPLSGWMSSRGTTTAFGAAENNQDHGIDAIDPRIDGVVSPPVVLGASNPLGEVDPGAVGAATNGPWGDGRDNLTADFGFVEFYDLTISKIRTSAATASVGDTVTYQIKVTNRGPATAVTGFTVDDRLPDGLTFAAVAGTGPNWVCALPQGRLLACRWTGADLVAGSSTDPLVVMAIIGAGAAGQPRNCAFVTPSAGQPIDETIPVGAPDGCENGSPVPTLTNPSNNDDSAPVTITPPPPPPSYDLALIKTIAAAPAVGTADVGDQVRWAIKVCNQGDVNSGAYVVTDRLPTGMEFLGATAGGTHSGRVVTWRLSNLAPGASRVVTVTVTVTGSTAVYRNWAEISTDSGDDEDSTPDTDTGQDLSGPNDEVVNHNNCDIDRPPNDEDDNDYEQILGRLPNPPTA